METVLDLMRDAVRRYDRKPFLLIRPGFRTRVTRYRDLGRIVPRVARVFHDHGLRKGDRVIIWAVNRPEWGISFLGAVHAGVILVPLDVRSAPEFVPLENWSRIVRCRSVIHTLRAYRGSERGRKRASPGVPHSPRESPSRAISRPESSFISPTRTKRGHSMSRLLHPARARERSSDNECPAGLSNEWPPSSRFMSVFSRLM